MATFYVALYWFPVGRLSDTTRMFVLSPGFHLYTGLITLDGLLNGRPGISLEALRHLVLPVVTLAGFHWATLSRITRSVMVEELGKGYVLAARARGLPDRQVVWRHAFRNALLPALNSCALSAAALLTGVFIPNN